MANQQTYELKATIGNFVTRTEEFSGRIRGVAAKAKSILAEEARSRHDEVKVYRTNPNGLDYVGKAMFCGSGTEQRIEWITKGSRIADTSGGEVRAIGINRFARMGVSYK